MQPPPSCFFLCDVIYYPLEDHRGVQNPIAPGCGIFVLFVCKIVSYTLSNSCPDLVYDQFSCTIRLSIQIIELFKCQLLKAFRNNFPGKILVYQHLPIGYKVLFERFLRIVYSFFTDVVSASPSIRSSLSAREIAIAGYSSRVSFSSSLCSSMILSKAKVLDALLALFEIVLTYLS